MHTNAPPVMSGGIPFGLERKLDMFSVSFLSFLIFLFSLSLAVVSSEHIQLELKLFFAIYHCLLHQKADIRRKALLLFIGGSQTLLISLLRLAGSLSTLQDNISSCNWMAECCICR